MYVASRHTCQHRKGDRIHNTPKKEATQVQMQALRGLYCSPACKSAISPRFRMLRVQAAVPEAQPRAGQCQILQASLNTMFQTPVDHRRGCIITLPGRPNAKVEWMNGVGCAHPDDISNRATLSVLCSSCQACGKIRMLH